MQVFEKKEGRVGLAALIEGTRVPSFAKWRWSTIKSCCEELSKLIDSFILYFRADMVGNWRETTLLSNVVAALDSVSWRSMLRFCTWFSKEMYSLLEWIGGCSCCAADDPDRSNCIWKGRRLKEAWEHVCSIFAQMFSEANSWVVDPFGAGLNLEELRGCVRTAAAFGKQSLVYLDRIPLLCARLGEAGVRDRCIEQYAEAPRDKHDRVSIALLDPELPSLRADVLAIDDSGGGVSSRLGKEIVSIAKMPMDDTVNESPHAIANRVWEISRRRSSFSWAASTIRLKQNLKDIAELPEQAGNPPLQKLWHNVKHVAPIKVRQTRKLFEQNLYCLQHCCGSDQLAVEAVGHGDLGGGDGGDDDAGDGGVGDARPPGGDGGGGGGDDGRSPGADGPSLVVCQIMMINMMINIMIVG